MSRIVVGVDESPAAGKALRWALHEAALRKCDLVAVSAWQVPEPAFNIYSPQAYSDLRAEVAEEHHRLAQQVLDAAFFLEAESADVHAIVEAPEGRPATVLVAESADADLVVVGARGLRGIRRAILGSTSADVVAHAACPVVVVHASGDDHSLLEEAETAAEIEMLVGEE
jgi:nucleotide-binding universal stress UspA family protein